MTAHLAVIVANAVNAETAHPAAEIVQSVANKSNARPMHQPTLLPKTMAALKAMHRRAKHAKVAAGATAMAATAEIAHRVRTMAVRQTAVSKSSSRSPTRRALVPMRRAQG